MSGRLIVVPTPIGNLGDITLRAIESLRSADIVYAEDTRRTQALLHHLGIRKPLRSLFLANERERGREAVADLEAGRTVALVSDAGTPGISDPGAGLVQDALAQGIQVDVLPGPQAILPALLLSGLTPSPFTFFGFLPRARAQRRAALADLRPLPWTLVFYEAPHRLPAMLADLLDVLGDRPAAVVREISKLHEESRRAHLSELVAWSAAESVRGEIAVVVDGQPPEVDRPAPEDLPAIIQAALAEGLGPSAAE